eukprot:1289686-Prymnesium_polylepis.1
MSSCASAADEVARVQPVPQHLAARGRRHHEAVAASRRGGATHAAHAVGAAPAAQWRLEGCLLPASRVDPAHRRALGLSGKGRQVARLAATQPAVARVGRVCVDGEIVRALVAWAQASAAQPGGHHAHMHRRVALLARQRERTREERRPQRLRVRTGGQLGWRAAWRTAPASTGRAPRAWRFSKRGVGARHMAHRLLGRLDSARVVAAASRLVERSTASHALCAPVQVEQPLVFAQRSVLVGHHRRSLGARRGEVGPRAGGREVVRVPERRRRRPEVPSEHRDRDEARQRRVGRVAHIALEAAHARARARTHTPHGECACARPKKARVLVRIDAEEVQRSTAHRRDDRHIVAQREGQQRNRQRVAAARDGRCCPLLFVAAHAEQHAVERHLHGGSLAGRLVGVEPERENAPVSVGRRVARRVPHKAPPRAHDVVVLR